MKRVIIESPYAGDVDKNEEYLARCVTDSLSRGEAPFASQGFYTRYLDDTNRYERATGMSAGWAWLEKADLVVSYEDYGVSEGMKQGLSVARDYGIPTESRYIGKKFSTGGIIPGEGVTTVKMLPDVDGGYVVPKRYITEYSSKVKEALAEMVNDPVSPDHYKAYKGLEIIELTEQMNFNRGNAVKYLTRAGLKDPDKELEDLEKAAWYVQREIERLSS